MVEDEVGTADAPEEPAAEPQALSTGPQEPATEAQKPATEAQKPATEAQKPAAGKAAPAESSTSPASQPAPASPRAPRRRAPEATNEHVRRSMQGNKGRDTKPELLVRERLRQAGLTGYRLQWKKAPGRPDVAWPGKKVALFVNGCYWHRCPRCQLSRPRTHSEYWEEKFRRNQERDRRNLELLEQDGWTVHVVWECELKKKAREQTFADLLPKLAQELGKDLLFTVGEKVEGPEKPEPDGPEKPGSDGPDKPEPDGPEKPDSPDSEKPGPTSPEDPASLT